MGQADPGNAAAKRGVVSKLTVVLLLLSFLAVFVLEEVAQQLGLAFPIARNEIAFALVPKLSADLTCLSPYADAEFIAHYPVTYANLAIYMSFLGFAFGYIVLGVALAQSGEGTGLAKTASERRHFRPVRARLLRGFLTIFAMAILPLGVSFYWSVCLRPSSGISKWRVEAGMLDSSILAWVGFMSIGLLVRGAIIHLRAKWL